MKVILLSDVKKVGKKGEIVEVSDGYGRNFLLNKKLAVLATKKSMEILDEQNLQHDLEEKQKEADAFVSAGSSGAILVGGQVIGG